MSFGITQEFKKTMSSGNTKLLTLKFSMYFAMDFENTEVLLHLTFLINFHIPEVHINMRSGNTKVRLP